MEKKEAMKILKDFYDKSALFSIRTALDTIIPELKENEDEKIRKEIKQHFLHLDDSFPDKTKWLTWLKNHSEKPQGKSALEAINEEKVDNANKVIVEPKFKVGDWIIERTYERCYKIIEIYKTWYDAIDSGGIPISIPFDNEYFFRLWTIQDAKDGDILVSKSNQPFIYNGKMDAQAIGSHGGVLSDGTIFICAFDDCNWTDIRFIHPATKEQRYFLFQKMKEAGYKLDLNFNAIKI